MSVITYTTEVTGMERIGFLLALGIFSFLVVTVFWILLEAFIDFIVRSMKP